MVGLASFATTDGFASSSFNGADDMLNLSILSGSTSQVTGLNVDTGPKEGTTAIKATAPSAFGGVGVSASGQTALLASGQTAIDATGNVKIKGTLSAAGALVE